MVESHSTLQHFAPYVPTSFPTRVISAVRSAVWVTLIQDNPLTWWWQQGRRNNRADMEGPLYVIGAPSRQIEPGKAVLATVEEMKGTFRMAEFSPFLLQLSIRSPKGDPLPNAKINLWHATTTGKYSYRSYALRGRFTTDANGNAEVLTIRPGDYGPAGILRTGHFHLMIQDREGKYDNLTSQLYVCKGNNPKEVTDILDRVRAPRPQNMLRSWCISANNGGQQVYGLPELSPGDGNSFERVQWWNDKLAAEVPEAGLKVVAGGRTEFTLNAKPGLFGF